MKFKTSGDRSETPAPRRRAVLRSLAVCGIGAAAFGLAGGNAFAVTASTVASFTLQQSDWSNTGTYYDNGVVLLVFQSDGNLVLYSEATGNAVWASGTNGRGATDLDWSASGYIKIKNSSGTTLCTVGALNPAPGGVADVQSDGNFVFYNTSGTATWSSGTFGGRSGNLNYCYS
jgi:hypothetical protein